jgi:serine/threonine-protein kinase
MLKQKHPQLVTVIFSEVKDATELIELINQGQIYRFVPKPVKVGYLKIVIQSALGKHKQIADNPDILKRHIVEGIDTEAEKGLMADVAQAAGRKSAGSTQSGGSASLLQKVTSGFMRLFRA